MRYDVLSQTINQVFQGNVCWVIYRDDYLGSPLRSEHYAVVETMYEDGLIESFVAPLVAGRDGLMIWANYFEGIFVGVMHQKDRPTLQEVSAFMKDIARLDQEIKDSFDEAMKEEEKDPPGLIKFEPKKRPKPSNPEGDK